MEASNSVKDCQTLQAERLPRAMYRLHLGSMMASRAEGPVPGVAMLLPLFAARGGYKGRDRFRAWPSAPGSRSEVTLSRAGILGPHNP
jgi:hypothetical protein